MISVDRDSGRKNIYFIIDRSEWKLETSACDAPVEPQTSAYGALSPVHVMHPNKTKENKTKEILLSSLLYEEIIKTNSHSRLIAQTPKQKEVTIASWAEDIDKLIRIDKQNPSIVEEVINKAVHDDFWGRNVLSGKALRKHWDKLTKAFIHVNAKPVAHHFNHEKPKAGYYTISKDGQWYCIKNGEHIRVDEDQVPESIRNKLTCRSTQAPPSPVSSLVYDMARKFAMHGAAK